MLDTVPADISCLVPPAAIVMQHLTQSASALCSADPDSLNLS